MLVCILQFNIRIRYRHSSYWRPVNYFLYSIKLRVQWLVGSVDAGLDSVMCHHIQRMAASIVPLRPLSNLIQSSINSSAEQLHPQLEAATEMISRTTIICARLQFGCSLSCPTPIHLQIKQPPKLVGTTIVKSRPTFGAWAYIPSLLSN